MADKESQLKLRITATNEAETPLKGVSEAMQSIEKSMSGLSGVIAEFTRAMSSTSDASMGVTRTLGGSQQAMSDFAKSTQGVADSISSDNRSFAALCDTLRSLDQTMANFSLSMDKMAEANSAMAAGMKSTAENTKGVKSAFTDAGLLIGMQMVGASMEHIGELGDGLFKNAINSAADFEASISRIHAVLMNREPTANMQEMADTALSLGQNSKFSANEIASGMYELARQGLSSTDILGNGVNGAIEIVNNLAQATDSSMSDTARIITDIAHEYNLSGDQLKSVGDIISGAMHTSSVSMQDLYMSMRQVGPVASSMHQSATDVSTALAILAQHGITGSQAGTALKNMFLGLEPRTQKAAELMKELGISAKDGAADSFYQLNGNLKPMPEILGILNDKFGGLNDKQKEAALAATFTKYGLAGLNVVATEGKDKFNEFKQALLTEDAASIAREKMNNLQGDMWRLHAATETLSKSFGNTLAPAMRGIAQAALSVVNWFAGLSDGTKRAIMVVGGFLSVLTLLGGALLTAASAFGFLAMGLGGLGIEFSAITAVILGPWGLVVAGIIAGVSLIIANWSTINSWVTSIFGQSIPQLLNGFWQVIKQIFTGIWTVIKDVWSNIKQATIEVWNYISPSIIGAVKEISTYWKQVWPEIKQLFTEVWNGMKVVLAPILAWLYMDISMALGFIKGAWHDAWNAIKDELKLIWDIMVDVIRIAWDLVSGIFKIALDLLTGHWKDAWNDMKSLLGNVWSDIKKLFGDFINDALSFGKDLVMAVAHGIEGAIGAVVAAAQKVVSAIKSIFSSAPKAPSVPSADPVQQAANAVPRFATGAVVNKPTLALIGEGGEEEYVIPKSKLQSQGAYSALPTNLPFSSGGMRGGGLQVRDINVTVVGVGKEGKQIGTDIASAIRQQLSFAI